MFKILSKSVREYKKYAIIAPLFISIEVAMEAVIPFLMALIIDNGIYKNDMQYIFKMSILIVGAALLSLTAAIIQSKSAAIASAGFAKNLRHDLFAKIQRFSFNNVNQFSSASLITRMTTDIQRMQMSFQMLIRICFRAPLMFLFSIIMVASIQYKMTVVFAIAIPILVCVIYLMLKHALPIIYRVFKHYDRLNNIVDENLLGIKTVKAYVREKEEISKFEETSGNIRKDNFKVEKILLLTNPIMMFVTFMCMLVLSYLGATLIVDGQMYVGSLMSIFTYTMQILFALMMIGMIIAMLTLSKASADRVVEVLTTKLDMDLKEDGLTDIKDGSIEFKDVCFKYSEESSLYCLNNINFKVDSGQTIGILGSTASGKTTLVSLIARLYDTKCGQVIVSGKDVKDYNIKALRDSVAVVLQKNQLFAGTIRSNMKWGNEKATDEEIFNALKKANATFITDLDSEVSQEGNNFSGGQKQRLCIARALLKNPKIIIFDDSTSAVDTKTDSLIREALKEIEATKIIISQRVLSVKDADKILILENGEIDDFNTPEALLETNEIYKDLVEVQLGGKIDG